MSQRPTIAIVGAGPAGLTAANIFHRHNWAVSIFDADASPDSRDQGGSLDLHVHEGQYALKKAGLYDAFVTVARHEDQEQRVLHHASGEVISEELPEPGTGDRPEIDRLVLRHLLLAPLDPAILSWSARVEEVVRCSDSRYKLRLPTGMSEPFDLVIGADGAWSSVRAALTDDRPRYTGVTFVELRLGDVDEQHAAIAKRVGHGTLFSLHDGRGIIAQRNGRAIIRAYAAFRTTAAEGPRPDRTLANITKEDLLSRFKGWSPSLTSLISEADAIAAVRPIVTLQPPLGWAAKDGLTLIGDAAHVMPPLGVGVNLAMLDAAELAECLINAECWRQAVRDYERIMIERSNSIAARCIAGLDSMFAARDEHLDA